MEDSTRKLNGYIKDFLIGTIDGATFEKVYSECFDFEDLDQDNFRYFEEIRQLLEHFSPYEKDLEEHSNYYLSERALREKIIALEQSY